MTTGRPKNPFDEVGNYESDPEKILAGLNAIADELPKRLEAIKESLDHKPPIKHNAPDDTDEPFELSQLIGSPKHAPLAEDYLAMSFDGVEFRPPEASTFSAEYEDMTQQEPESSLDNLIIDEPEPEPERGAMADLPPTQVPIQTEAPLEKAPKTEPPATPKPGFWARLFGPSSTPARRESSAKIMSNIQPKANKRKRKKAKPSLNKDLDERFRERQKRLQDLISNDKGKVT